MVIAQQSLPVVGSDLCEKHMPPTDFLIPSRYRLGSETAAFSQRRNRPREVKGLDSEQPLCGEARHRNEAS